MTTNILILAIIALILGLAIGYIRKEKKRGVKCVGCPAGGCSACSQNGGCSANCCSHAEAE